MVWLCLALVAVSFAVALPATFAARALGRRLSALDAAGVSGQVKAPPRRVPNTGGVGIFLGFAAPLIAALAAARLGVVDSLAESIPTLRDNLPYIHERTSEALWFLGSLLVLHIVGLIDDRRPLGPRTKLVAMLGVAAAIVLATDSRLLTLLDPHAGGPWLSVLITVCWMVLITNAFNFIDNMDGLAGGVAAIAGAFFLVAAVVNGQWLVAAALALLIGSLMGFLVFNFPWKRGRGEGAGGAGGASVFMGDGGSLVVGFALAFLTVRTTYYQSGEDPWYGVLMPFVVLAIPLYDFFSVTLIRLSQGKSPFVGDLQHFSHRLVRRGLSKRAAVIVIYGLTAITAIGGVSLRSLDDWQAILVGVQTALVLLVLAIFEWRAGANAARLRDTPTGAGPTGGRP